VTVCNSLALLISQGSSNDFAVRLALLTALQKCWLNGHSIVQLVCSCDGAMDFVSGVVLHDSSTNIVSGSGVHITEDADTLDIQSRRSRDDDSAGEAWLDSTVEPTSQYLSALDSMEENFVVAAHGSETLLFFFYHIMQFIMGI